MERNDGIQITGGIKNISRAADALGGAGQDEIALRLRELGEAIAAQSERIDEVEELLRAAESLAEEVAKPEPNRLTVRALLSGMTRAAGSVSGVAAAVTALRAALGEFL